MNQLFRIAVLLMAVLGVLVPVAPAPAQADPIGGVIIIPGAGNDLHAIRLRTSAGCPAEADAFYATMKGRGFPTDGQVVTANTAAGLSHSFGFDVYFELVMRDFANDNNTTLGGRYDITVFCVNRLTLQSYGEFTGSLEFTTPTHYEALGPAKPTGPPPLPLALTGDGTAVAPDMDPLPAGPPPGTGPPSGAAPDPSSSAPTAQAPPGSDPQPPSAAGQLIAQRNDATDQGVWWLVLSGAALVTVAVVTLVALAVTSRTRKRRSM